MDLCSTSSSSAFPVPGRAPSRVAVPAPDHGEQRWAGAPTALLDGPATLLVHRVRDGDGDRVVVGRSEDGESFSPLACVPSAGLGVAMVERAALVPLPRTGGGRTWRLYVSCAEPGTTSWWIGLLESPTLEGLPAAPLRRLDLRDPAGPADAVKDPIVRRRSTGAGGWEMWVCVHPLHVPGAEDRMSTAYATSDDGVAWRWHGTVLAGRPGRWDARGARVTSVLPDGRACYDGRATAEENWFERTGLADPATESVPTAAPALVAADAGPVADVRYLDVLPLPQGGHRLYYEAGRPDGAHELRTELQA